MSWVYFLGDLFAFSRSRFDCAICKALRIVGRESEASEGDEITVLKDHDSLRRLRRRAY